MQEGLHPYSSFAFTYCRFYGKNFSTIWTKFVKRFVLKIITKKTLF